MKKYTDLVSLDKFKKLPLENRAQVTLRDHFNGRSVIEDYGFLNSLPLYIEAWKYIEDKKYVNSSEGLPKSFYDLTNEGILFMEKDL
jgi:hypothetical protein